MTTFIEALSYMTIGIYLTIVYKILSEIEPFSFYLPGGVRRYYKVHKDITTKFSDVIGSENIKKELRAHLRYFQEEELTKGFVFQGPTGCGKTFMAKAIAGESEIPFIEIFNNDHITTVLNTVIKKYSPCIIFIDECCDVTFLRELDEMDKIFLILATNEEVNPAMCRSGRIDKVIKFQLPTYDDRLELFESMGYEEKSFKLAQQTGGLSFADISIIPRESKFVMLLEEKPEEEILDKVIETLKFGRHTSEYNVDPVLSRRLAYHEVGHLFLSYVLKGFHKPNNVTIIPKGQFAGNVAFNIKDDIYKTQTDILGTITVLLASSIFETHYLGEYSTLCKDDFDKIDELFVTMKDNQMLGYTFLHTSSNETQEAQILEIMDKLKTIIVDCINIYGDEIDELHAELLLRESLNEKEIKEILGTDIYDSITLDF
jgi:ATP-dependent Zn protease